MQEIQAIHTSVNGRARFKIPGLRNTPSVKQYLEHRLARRPDIIAASASSVTGSLLVSYNSGNDHKSIGRVIEEIVQDYAPDAKGHLSPKRAAKFDDVEITSAPPKKEAAGKPEALSPVPLEEKDTSVWHVMPGDSVLNAFQTNPDEGLSGQLAQALLKRNGPNQLPESKPRSKLGIFWDQLNSLPVYLLGAAAGVSVLTGGLFDATVIVGVVAANAVIGYCTESKAEKTISSLKNLVKPQAEVIRDNQPITIPIESVVPGDILVLKPGVYVAADARIISAAHLSIDESMLTGESMPVAKHAKALEQKDVSLGDRTNMAYMGTLVTGGQGLAVAVATGEMTQIGRIQLMLNQTRPPETPIERQLGDMGDRLVLMCGGICGGVFLIGLFRGYGFLRMMRMAISLAAAAVPEGLPAAATINFALGINKMRQHNVLIRHLYAVETLGAIQAICMDKTGTITHNQMTVQRICSGETCYEVDKGRLLENGQVVDPFFNHTLSQLIIVCSLCHEIKINGRDQDNNIQLFGSATEKALVQLSIDVGLDVEQVRDEYERLEINHRAENRLYMSTLHLTPENEKIFCVKGSPIEVLSMCAKESVNGNMVPLTEERRMALEDENEKMASKALRVLGFACKQVTEETVDNESDLVWLGLVGMADPVREGVQPLIKMFHKAGVDTVMITGDQNSTAYAIADELNLAGEEPLEILDSSDLTAMKPETLQALAKQAHVYSRVTPAHKLQIVQALQAAGVTVAMTGDGINDGPALKAADIGIAMGKTGTDVARDVADVVLEEDNLETLALALEDGRAIYGNIRKSVHFFLATNISEIMLMTVAMGVGIGFPLNVMQLMWINIISDIFPGLALSMEPPEEDIMEQPPRDASAPLFSTGDFVKMTKESAAITGGALAAYGYGIARYGMGAGATSLAFQSLTIGQLLHALSCRSETSRILDKNQTTSNPYLGVAVGGSLALQALTMFFPPLRSVLGLTAPSLVDLGVVAATSLAGIFLNETAKPGATATQKDRTVPSDVMIGASDE